MLAARGCSAHSGSLGGTVAADGGRDAGPGAPSAQPSATCKAPTGVPAGIPSGWDFYGDLENCCQLYVPRSTSDLPAPVKWRACDSSARPQGLSCQQMVEDWPPDSVNSGISPWVLGDVQSGGQVRLQVSRFTTNVNYRLIADADGPVWQAIAEANSGQDCTLGGSDLKNGKYVYFVYADDGSGLVRGALAGDSVDFRPRVYLDYVRNPVQAGFAAGLPGVLEENAAQALILHSWAAPAQAAVLWTVGDDDGLYQNFPFFWGDALFWSSDAVAAQTFKLKVYTAAGGVRDFISFGQGAPNGVSSLGTDGHDLVWLQGDGLNPNPTALDGGGAYTTVSVVTSPFTTDPAAVVPRRLRSESAGFFGGPPGFHVGCGYAARFTQLGTWGVLIVRLADGQSWFLTNPDGTSWSWVDAVALTCTEFFGVVALQGNTRTVARVRLDSLGPGMPPD